MYSYICGKVVYQNKSTVTLVANNWGIDVTLMDIAANNDYLNKSLVLYLHYINTEFIVSQWFGFFTAAGRELFLRLMEVPGVGVKIISRIMGKYTVKEFLTAIEQKAADQLVLVPGVKQSLAQTIIGHLSKAYFHRVYSEIQNNVILCLRDLGYNLKAIYQAMDIVVPSDDLDNYVKLMLLTINGYEPKTVQQKLSHESLSS